MREWFAKRALRERRMLFVGGLAVCAWSILTGVVRPAVREIHQVREELDAERALLARELRLLTDASAFGVQFEAIEREVLGQASTLFSGTDDALLVHALAEHVGNAAAKSRVVLQVLEAMPAREPTEGVMTLRVRIEGVSDLRGVAAMIADLEAGRKQITIEELAISRLQAERAAGQQDLLGMVATVAGYALVESPVRAGAADRPPAIEELR